MLEAVSGLLTPVRRRNCSGFHSCINGSCLVRGLSAWICFLMLSTLGLLVKSMFQICTVTRRSEEIFFKVHCLFFFLCVPPTVNPDFQRVGPFQFARKFSASVTVNNLAPKWFISVLMQGLLTVGDVRTCVDTANKEPLLSQAIGIVVGGMLVPFNEIRCR
jgi:hypothetical protein